MCLPMAAMDWKTMLSYMHLDQNVPSLATMQYAGLDSGPLGWPLYRCHTACAFYLFIRAHQT